MLLLAINLRPVVNALGAVIPELRDTTGLPAATTGLLLSLPTLSFAVLGLAAPALAASASEIADSLGGLVPDVDRAAMTGEFADFLAASFHQAGRQGVRGWRDDDLLLL